LSFQQRWQPQYYVGFLCLTHKATSRHSHIYTYTETRLKISLTRVMAAMHPTLLNTINYTIRLVVHIAASFITQKIFYSNELCHIAYRQIFKKSRYIYNICTNYKLEVLAGNTYLFFFLCFFSTWAGNVSSAPHKSMWHWR